MGRMEGSVGVFGVVCWRRTFISLLSLIWGFVQFLDSVASMLSSIVKNKVLQLFFLNGIATSALAKPAEILVFGGNGFIGSECVKSLLQDGHKITVLNRGNSYWDYNTRIKPYVKEVHCDRDQGLEGCENFNLKHKAFDFVIDFSAYRPHVIKNAIHNLDKIDTYIYISSDSVYEVSKASGNKLSKESDAVRPEDKDEQSKLNDKDWYGHNKLAGEEVLKELYDSYKVPFVSFRLPDVIGPRDSTYRWWTYQVWLQLYSFERPLVLPHSAASLSTSYVYVKDVAKMISQTVMQIQDGNNSSHFQAFNIAFPEGYSVKKLLDSMQKALEIKGVEYQYRDDAYHVLPSVTRGPVDISKATEMLQWEATPWDKAVQETVAFFKDALFRFQNEKNILLKGLVNLVDEDINSIDQRVKHHLKFQGADSSEKLNPDLKRHNEL